MVLRGQPQRLTWPLTPAQVESLDEMLYELYRRSGVSLPPGLPVPAPHPLSIPGIDGVDGEDGAPGPAGVPGVAGAAGVAGPAGPMGLGLDGEDGVDGVPGAPGPRGASGSPGAPGVDGQDGEDAFPIGVPSSLGLTGSPTAITPVVTDNSSRLATTAFVTTAITNAIAGVNPAVAVQAATNAILPNSPAYVNGVSGIGATITAGVTNTTLVVDGYTPLLNDRILVKNEASGGGLGASRNGVYTVTTLAGVAVAWVLTRALDYDQPSDINNTGAIPVVHGTANAQTQWVLTSSVGSVGVDALTFTQFSISPTSILVGTAPIAHGVLLGAGTQTVGVTGAGTAGQTLTSNGGSADPSFQNTPLQCSVFHNTTQTIATSTNTVVSFNSHDYDTGGLHSDVTNNSRITIPVGGAGIWLLTYYVFWSTVSGVTLRQALFNKNGSLFGGNDLTSADTGGNNCINTVSLVTQAADGDYFEVIVEQSSGGNMTIGSGSRFAQSTFTATRLRQT